MEQWQVTHAIQELHAAGKAASIQNIHRQLGFGSKRDVVRHKRAIANGGDPMPETATVTQDDEGAMPWKGRVGLPPGEDITPRRPPTPAPAPIAKSVSDPVETARALLEDAEAQLDGARADMDAATIALWVSSGVVHNNIRDGAYLPGDDAREHLIATAAAAQDAYRDAFAQRERCKDQLALVTRQHHRQRQENHVALHAPELLQQRDHWQYQVTHATSDRMHAEAKKNLQQATFNYERAVATAPVEED